MVLSFDKGVDCTWKYKGILGLQVNQCVDLVEMVADNLTDFETQIDISFYDPLLMRGVPCPR